MLIKQIFILAIVTLVICKSSNDNVTQIIQGSQQKLPRKGLTQQQIIKNDESQQKHEVNLFKGHFQQYNFKISKYADFIITPDADQMVTVTVDVLWKQKDMYLLAPVQKSQEVSVFVSELKKPSVYNDSFYTMAGFKFKASQKTSYKIVFTQKGKQEKMLLVKVSQKIKPPKKAAKKGSMKLFEEKLLFSLGKLEVPVGLFRTRYQIQKQEKSQTDKFQAMSCINLQHTLISKFFRHLQQYQCLAYKQFL